MEESMGPTEVSCPLSYFELVPCPTVGYAAAWRERVRAHHANTTKFNGKLAVGTKVRLKKGLTLSGSPVVEVTITSLKPLNAVNEDLRSFRLPKKYIDAIL